MYLPANIYEDLDLDLGESKAMCKCNTNNNTTTTPIPTSAVIRRRRSTSMVNNKNEKSKAQTAAARPNSKTYRAKSQKKTRKKPKFLSLKRQLRSVKLTAAQNQKQGQIDIYIDMNISTPTSTTDTQLNLFPLHPEDRDDNMAYFFSAADGGASTLTGLLDDAAASSSSAVDASPSGEDVKSFSESPSLTYACDEENEGKLVRTAIRSKERDASEEERWVRYSEVVERKEEEVNSCCCVSAAEFGCKMRAQRRRLSLKLDYQEIMNAWSDRGPLYVHLDSPQTVPDLLPEVEFLALDLSSCLRETWGGNGGLWRVPEMSIKVKEEVQPEPGGDDYWRIGQREASVLRYKEKRRSRLFAKKIRYEVRKLNAEKRPRIKGRFVKRG